MPSFRSDKTAVLGAIKTQLPFSELLNSWNKIPLPTIFSYFFFLVVSPENVFASFSNTSHDITLKLGKFQVYQP